MDPARVLALTVRLAARNVVRGGGGPFAAVVVRDGRILGLGANRVTPALDPTAHAEVMAIRHACARAGDFKLEGATLYSSCEPCPMCLGAIYWARIERVVYASDRTDAKAAGFDDEWIYAEFERPPAARGLPAEQLRIPAAGDEFAAWTEFQGRVEY